MVFRCAPTINATLSSFVVGHEVIYEDRRKRFCKIYLKYKVILTIFSFLFLQTVPENVSEFIVKVCFNISYPIKPQNISIS